MLSWRYDSIRGAVSATLAQAMPLRKLLFRSLAHYRSMHAAVACGVAVGAAVLAGALLVGGSVRGSLRGLTLDRLGDIDHALVAERYVREELAAEIAGFERVSAAVAIRGSAENAQTGARASRVNIHGVDETFWGFYGMPAPEIGRREIVVNAMLARELGAAEGDAVVLRFQADTLIPAESVMGRKTDGALLLRLRVAGILPDRGPGRFGLSPNQQLPFNVFVNRGALQQSLEQPGRVNALFVAGGSVEDLRKAFAEAVSFDDLEIDVRALDDGRRLAAQTGRIVFERHAAAWLENAAEAAGLDSVQTLTYLANAIESGGRSIPYSTVTALERLPAGLRLAGGLRKHPGAPALAADDLLLNRWAADDLQAKPGDEVALSYYELGPGGALVTGRREFRLKGIVEMSGAALDRGLAPEYSGLSDAERIGDWDPPFPVDLGLIRNKDEDYWDRYRTAPKAWVALETAKQLWSNRFGQLTSLRLGPVEDADIGRATARFEQEARKRLDPAAFGLVFQPVKQQGLEAAAGATDFSGLFVGFSMFLIASAALLVALLFRLGVERRAKEIGLLLAVGQKPSRVRLLLAGEGALTAAAGCLIGIPGAAAYAALMVYGLRTWWSAAVGGSFLELHVEPDALIFGAAGAFLLMFLSVWFSLRKLERLAPRALLSGATEPPAWGESRGKSVKRLQRTAFAAALSALGMAAAGAFGDGASARLGAFFGAGTLALAAALIWFRGMLLAPARSAAPAVSIFRLGMRNGARHPTRSLLSAALVACAAFLLTTVAMYRQDAASQEPARDSGDGGFRWIAESDLPLFRNRLEDEDLGAMTVFPLRRKAGEDASCLNLYQPAQPTLLGVPPELIARGGFAFQGTLAETEAERENPWLLLEKDFDGAIPVFGDMNSVTWILHLALGSELTVTDDSGRERRLRIAGLLTHSIFQSELVMSEENFLRMAPGRSGFHTLLVETDAAGAALALEERFADRGLDAARSADRLAGFLVVQNTYLSTFQTLGGLGLLLGVAGLAVVMIRNVLERRGELALLQAVGFAESSIARLVLSENSFLLLFGLAVGSLAGLLAAAPHLLSGAADPPWLSLAAMLAGIAAAGLPAGAGAAAVSLRAPLLEGLRRD